MGPAPLRGSPPFRTGDSTSPHFHWRWWWDYGGGVLPDIASHFIDPAHFAVNHRHATTMDPPGRGVHQGGTPPPDLIPVHDEFPALRADPAVSSALDPG